MSDRKFDFCGREWQDQGVEGFVAGAFRAPITAPPAASAANTTHPTTHAITGSLCKGVPFTPSFLKRPNTTTLAPPVAPRPFSG
jgi:hypothetical protein